MAVIAREQRITSEQLDERFSVRVLCVSEDPAFIHEIQTRLKPEGVHVVGCVGPTQASCPLMCGDTCPLAHHADIALIDSPPSGSFVHYWQEIQVGPYAEYLQKDSPGTFVIVSGAPAGPSGPSGEVAHVADRDAAIDLLTWLARTQSGEQHPETERGSPRSRPQPARRTG